MLVQHGERETRAEIRAAFADPFKEPQVLGEAAERYVRAVVGRRLRVAVAFGQRLHRAAERRARLVERHVLAGIDELERGGKTGEAAAHDGDGHASSPRATTASF